MNRLVILPTLIKSMFYQSNWNILNMQGTGFIWLIKDFFKHNKTELPKDFDIDSVYYFNTNPYLVTFILGILLKEARVNGKIGSYDKIYASVLAALGDTFFWHSLRPFVFFVSLIAIMIEPSLVVIVYFILFNIFNIVFKILGFYYGYEMGGNVIKFFNKIRFNMWSRVFDGFTVFMTGIVISYIIKYQYIVGSVNILSIALILVAGIFVAVKVKSPVELILVTSVFGILILFGV